MNKKLNAKNVTLGTIIFLLGSLMLVTSIWDWTIWYYPEPGYDYLFSRGGSFFSLLREIFTPGIRTIIYGKLRIYTEFYNYFLLRNFPTLSFPLQFRDLVNFVRLLLAITVMLSPFFAKKRAKGISIFLFSLATVFTVLNAQFFFKDGLGIVHLYGKARTHYLFNIFLEDFWHEYSFFLIFAIVAIISMILMIKAIKGSKGAKRTIVIISLIAMISFVPMVFFGISLFSDVDLYLVSTTDAIMFRYNTSPSYYVSPIIYYFSYFTAVLCLTLLYFNRVKTVNVKDMLIDMKNETNIIEELAKEKQEHKEAEPEQEATEDPAEQVNSEE